ncbi:MAG: bifunctional phosphoribosylaminoimidazolecarboxamide formyltransferase/IMP cyclohydrolase, partial [Planctomycetaceae bacterium]
GLEITSPGGARRVLEEAGVPVIDMSEYTGFPGVMDGRVKTLHPKVHGALLGRPGTDDAVFDDHGIVPFQIVAVNLYAFAATIAKPDVTVEQAIEQIDIGGPSMIRSAAKNHAFVGVVTKPKDYDSVLTALKEDTFDATFRRKLAATAFETTAAYDRGIADYMATVTSDEEDKTFPPTFAPAFTKQASLRYGENPHQAAAFYLENDAPAASLAGAVQRNGKDLSYNNLFDLDAAYLISTEFEEPAAVVIKHSNPCGCAIGATLSEATEAAFLGDPVSAFGSIVGLNRQVDAETAERLWAEGRFVEAIIAPSFTDEAFEILTTKPKWKKNVRLMECPQPEPGQSMLDYRRVSGGLLVQERDDQADPEEDWKVVTDRQPTEDELRDLRFAWRACKYVKSNAILLAKEGAVVGVGAGQMSRLDSSFIAAHKAGDRSKGSVLASDAFFPFRDGVDEAAKAGVTAIIEPGGSRRDDEVIAACNEHNIAMIFTARRHFRH